MSDDNASRPTDDQPCRVHAKRAMIVDRDVRARHSLAHILSRHGSDVLQAANAQDAELVLHRRRPDVTIVDTVVDARSGIQLVHTLKTDGRTSSIPLIVLTARSDEEGRLRAFEAGADDCVIKTVICVDELMARIRAIFRRTYRNEPSGLMRACGLVLNVVSHRVTYQDRVVQLAPLAFRLLSYLMAHPDRVLTRTMILSHVWGEDLPEDVRAVDAQMKQLRHLLKTYRCEQCIQTVYGIGYRFSAPGLH